MYSILSINLPIDNYWEKFYRRVGLVEASSQGKVLLKSILFKSIFKGIRVFEWAVADQLVNKYWSNFTALEKEAFVALLSLSCTRQPSVQVWESYLGKSLPDVKQFSRLTQFGKQSLVDFLFSSNLIEKSEFQISLDRNCFVPLPGVKPSQYIGVGYKDKGYNALLRHGYDPVAHVRILSKIPATYPFQSPVSFDEEFSTIQRAMSLNTSLWGKG